MAPFLGGLALLLAAALPRAGDAFIYHLDYNVVDGMDGDADQSTLLLTEVRGGWWPPAAGGGRLGRLLAPPHAPPPHAPS
jgi:hypothetical protein